MPFAISPQGLNPRCANRSISKVAAAALIVLASTLTTIADTGECLAQGTQADFQRMQDQRKFSNDLLDRYQMHWEWVEEDQALWYRVSVSPNHSEYHWVNPTTGENKLLFDSQSLENWLAEETIEFASTSLSNLTLQVSDSMQISFPVGDVIIRFDPSGSRFSQWDPTDVSTPATASSFEVRPSTDGGESINLTILNKTQQPIQLFWIDAQRNANAYQTVAPGESVQQHTFQGHQWLVRDTKGRNLKWIDASANAQEVQVQEGDTVELTYEGRNRRQRSFFLAGNANGVQDQPDRRPAGGDVSPDRKWRAVVRDHNIVLISQQEDGDDNKERIVTSDGTEGHFYTNRFFWSPDSQFLVVLHEKPAQSHPVHFVESSPKDQLQPKLHTFQYLKPGDEIRHVQPRLYSVESGQLLATDNQLFNQPWNLSEFRWTADSQEFLFLYNQRGHQVMRVCGIDRNGQCRSVINEPCDTFFDYTNKTVLHWLDESDQIIWGSERSGFQHLYLYNRASGQVENAITSGDWVVREIQKVDAEKKQIWFSACGVFPGQDPYQIHFGRVNFDGTQLTWLTEADGNHSIEFSPGRKYLIDTYSRPDLPPVRELRNTETGSLVCQLEASSWDRLKEAGWQAPETFVAKGRDGETDIYGLIYRPQNFDPDKSYPVIEYIYAGPHDAFVPKSFFTTRREKSLAELGFIVVQIDGMGTNHRGKAFHDVCWKNLGDSGFPDRILWMKAAAAKYPQMNLDRVGIYGGSAGGQSSTRAVLAYGDFYKVAVSDCGCHDNRMDKIWWNEQWMGYPIGDHYAEQSNVTQAHRLEGKLMLMVGEMDRNVDPASTMQVVDALIKADKDFDLLVFPGGGHGSGFSQYGFRRLCDFFVRHLLDVQPRAN